ncbi:hypothetical protein ACQFYA_13185 [Promicromonospora sp. Marseille-Q5078]
MDANVYDMLFERRQAELEREVTLRRLSHELRVARRAIRDDASLPAPQQPRRRRATVLLQLPRHA